MKEKTETKIWLLAWSWQGENPREKYSGVYLHEVRLAKISKMEHKSISCRRKINKSEQLNLGTPVPKQKTPIRRWKIFHYVREDVCIIEIDKGLYPECVKIISINL